MVAKNQSQNGFCGHENLGNDAHIGFNSIFDHSFISLGASNFKLPTKVFKSLIKHEKHNLENGGMRVGELSGKYSGMSGYRGLEACSLLISTLSSHKN